MTLAEGGTAVAEGPPGDPDQLDSRSPVPNGSGRPSWRRVVLKVSGEAFAGDEPLGISPAVVIHLAREITAAAREGVQIAVVVGGGNMFRGAALSERGIDRSRADYMGMLGTVINCLALQDVLEKLGVETRVQTATTMGQVAEPYIPRRAIRHLEKGRVVIFAAGTGNPYFSTDTAAALRAIQMKADVIIKATSVDGIYSADPKRFPDAEFYPTLSYNDVMRNELEVMDQTAITLCKENQLPLIVLNINNPGAVARAVCGERVGTLVS